jgi:uncharacterized UBP type Zn finger protein
MVRDGGSSVNNCQHLWVTSSPLPSADGCEECLRIGSEWVHLRMCMTCGHVGCCDYSPNKHASAHFHQSDHPVIRSFQPGESWLWCYPDEIGYDPEDVDLEGADLS